LESMLSFYVMTIVQTSITECKDDTLTSPSW
jgi:hypothetical protein